MWSGWCPRCSGVHYRIWAELAHHIHRHSRGFDVGNDGLRRIPPPRVIVVVAAAAIAMVWGSGLFGKCSERGIAATMK